MLPEIEIASVALTDPGGTPSPDPQWALRIEMLVAVVQEQNNCTLWLYGLCRCLL